MFGKNPPGDKKGNNPWRGSHIDDGAYSSLLYFFYNKFSVKKTKQKNQTLILSQIQSFPDGNLHPVTLIDLDNTYVATNIK